MEAGQKPTKNKARIRAAAMIQRIKTFKTGISGLDFLITSCS